MVAYSARPTSSNQLTQLVNLAAHGFTVGQVLIYFYNGGTPKWQPALADSLADCAGSWIVSFVPSVDSFYITQEGWVNNLSGYGSNIGQQFYLSPTSAGTLTDTIPSTVGQVILPCFVPDTATSGYFYGGSGYKVVSGGGGGAITWQVVTGNTTMVSNNGYFVNSGSSAIMTLPAAFALGDVIEIAGISTGGWTLAQNSGQSVLVGQQGATTAGPGHGVAATNGHDSITLIGITANTLMYGDPTLGSLTIY